MEIPNREEVAILTETIGAFYKGLIANGIPSELACQLTGAYFSDWLNWDEGDDGDDDEGEDNELPYLRPWGPYPEAARFPFVSE